MKFLKLILTVSFLLPFGAEAADLLKGSTTTGRLTRHFRIYESEGGYRYEHQLCIFFTHCQETQSGKLERDIALLPDGAAAPAMTFHGEGIRVVHLFGEYDVTMPGSRFVLPDGSYASVQGEDFVTSGDVDTGLCGAYLHIAKGHATSRAEAVCGERRATRVSDFTVSCADSLTTVRAIFRCEAPATP